MWELTKRISLRIFSFLSKVEPEPDLYSCSDQKVPAPAGRLCQLFHYMRKYNAESPKQGGKRFN